MSTLNQIQNNYITLSISTTNNSIKTIVIQNPWRLNLHCGDQINWTFETNEKKKKYQQLNWTGEKKIVKFNCLKILSRNWPENWTKIQRSKTIISFDWPIQLETSTAEVYFEIDGWIVRVCANCKCLNFWHKYSLWVKVAIFQLRRNSMLFFISHLVFYFVATARNSHMKIEQNFWCDLFFMFCFVFRFRCHKVHMWFFFLSRFMLQS